MSKPESKKAANPSQLITNQIAELGDWRASIYARLRKVINDAVPGMTEEWKWNTAVWDYHGLVCAVGAFKELAKYTQMGGGFIAFSLNGKGPYSDPTVGEYAP